MMQRRFIYLVFALVLSVSLFTGITAGYAQQPPPLPQVFTWQPLGVSVRYPADWVVTQENTIVSISPANRNVDDGFGPELILFDQPNTPEAAFEAAIAEMAATAGATYQITGRTTQDGVRKVRAALRWNVPAAAGEMMLLAAKDTTAVGAVYIVRDTDAAAYRATLAAIFESVALGAATLGVNTISAGVASVQTPQAYVWEDAGLMLYFPDDWTVELEVGAEGRTVVATAGAPDVYNYMQATIFDDLPIDLGLDIIVDLALEPYGAPLNRVTTTVAGYNAVIADVRDTSTGSPMIIRFVTINLVDRGVVGVCLYAAAEPDWGAFRPLVSAMISEIARY